MYYRRKVRFMRAVVASSSREPWLQIQKVLSVSTCQGRKSPLAPLMCISVIQIVIIKERHLHCGKFEKNKEKQSN